MDQVQFRSYVNQDLEAVRQLHRLGLENTDSEIRPEIIAELDKDINNIPQEYLRGGDFLVGFVGNQLVAMGGLQQLNNERAEIKRMRVHPSVQGHGAEPYLFQLLENRALQLGYKEVTTNTSSGSAGLQQFLLNHGYLIERREQHEGSPLEIVHYVKRLA